MSDPANVSPRNASPRNANASPRNVSPRNVSPRNVSPRNVSPRSVSPRNADAPPVRPRSPVPLQRRGSLMSAYSSQTPARPAASFASPLQSYIPDAKTNQDHVVTFSEIVEELKSKYNFEESVTSTSLDILALYLKGQKILHTESKTLCEKRLNSLMLPAIIISSVCAILNFAVEGTSYGPV